MKRIMLFVFPFIFAVAVAAIWEFTTDSLFNLTAQNDLKDTMWDIILGSFG